MGWFESAKQYVRNEYTTPYFVNVNKLNRKQADKELFVYVLFLVNLFGFLTLFSCGAKTFPGDTASLSMSLHAFTVVVGAMVLGWKKHPLAALYCISAPIAAILFAVINKMQAGRESVGDYLFLGFSLGWLYYSRRVYAIARAYRGLPLPPPDAQAGSR